MNRCKYEKAKKCYAKAERYIEKYEKEAAAPYEKMVKKLVKIIKTEVPGEIKVNVNQGLVGNSYKVSIQIEPQLDPYFPLPRPSEFRTSNCIGFRDSNGLTFFWEGVL